MLGRWLWLRYRGNCKVRVGVFIVNIPRKTPNTGPYTVYIQQKVLLRKIDTKEDTVNTFIRIL